MSIWDDDLSESQMSGFSGARPEELNNLIAEVLFNTPYDRLSFEEQQRVHAVKNKLNPTV